MKRFQSILTDCDESVACAQAVARGLWLAEANGARVTMMDVNPAASDTLSRAFSRLPETHASEISGQVQDCYGALLEQHAETFRAAGVPVDARVREGVPFIEIIHQVVSGGHDIVNKSALTGESGRRTLAGIDMHLLRKCPCPVWILHENQPATARKILAAIDPDPNGEPQTSLNRVVMELTPWLSVRDEAEVHVIGAWRLQEEMILRSGLFRMPDGEIDMIVMGTEGRTGVGGFFIGNTAETILPSDDCSVLTAKPAGFASPISLNSAWTG